MQNTALALLQRGDIEGLLALHHGTFGDLVMTSPAEPVVVIPADPPAPPQRVDMNDPAIRAAVEQARKEEKDKLYATLEEEKARTAALEQRMEAFGADLTARQQAEEAAKAAAAKAEEEKRQAELSFGEKLQEFQVQQDAKIQGLEQQITQSQALLAKEAEYTQLLQYRSAALQNENPEGPGRGLGPAILPQLRELVSGNTVEEIESSISALAERSGSILADVAQATSGQLTQSRGVGVTAPPVGPMENNSGYQTMSLEELQGMDMTQYGQLRERLLGAASRPQQNKGLFG